MKVGWTERALKSLQECGFSPTEQEAVHREVQHLCDSSEGQINLHGLDLERIEGARDRWWRMKFTASGKGVRVAYQSHGGVVAVGFVTIRDGNTYQRMLRVLNQTVLTRFNDGLSFVELPDPTQIRPIRSNQPVQIAAKPRDRDNPLTPISRIQLQEMGLSEQAVGLVRTLGPEIDVADTLGSAGIVAEIVELILGIWTAPQVAIRILDEGRIPTRQDVTVGEQEFADRASHPDSLMSLAELTAEEFQQALAGTIDAWMFYLHPTQSRIVEAAPTGPMRVSGGPGTGKTVVGLHRARWLVRNGHADRVLMTTFTNVLPQLWDQLLDKFAPQESASIETATIDKIAREIVSQSGGLTNVVDSGQERILATNSLFWEGVPNELINPQEFVFEIEDVIVGRLLDRKGYLATQRRGRNIPLSKPNRERIWQAYERYCGELNKRGLTDWPHLRAEALRLARDGGGPRFDAIVVDEAQDLTEAHLNLILALDNDPEHKGLLLVGDGQQRIYPGGYSLASVGVNVRGRSTLLRTNWRNTQFIMDAAEAVIGDLSFGDLDEPEKVHRGADAVPLPLRLGDPVELWRANNVREAHEYARLIVDDLLTRYEPDDIAVLVRTNTECGTLRAVLNGVPTRLIADRKWIQTSGVSVGTHFRSKGLEFKAVVLLKIEENALNHAINKAVDPEDAIARWTRTLFVAMTRARDSLYIVGIPPLAEPFARACDEAAFDVL